jgi:hypothetical protein
MGDIGWRVGKDGDRTMPVWGSIMHRVVSSNVHMYAYIHKRMDVILKTAIIELDETVFRLKQKTWRPLVLGIRGLISFCHDYFCLF